jgi:hypothetical protein
LKECTYFFQNKKSYGCLLLFMEKADGNLYDILKEFQDRSMKIPRDLWLSMLFQIFAGIHAIQHRFGLIHRDLHWKNVLYWNVKQRGYWRYYVKKIPYYVPCVGYQFGLTDFGKSMRREDVYLSQTSSSNQKTSSSKHIFIQGDDERWRDWYVYQSKKLIEDLHRISHLPKWMQDNGMQPGFLIPPEIQELFKKLNKEWTTDKHYLPGEIIMLSMSQFLDQRIGLDYKGVCSEEVDDCSPGSFVVYNKKLAMVAERFEKRLKLITGHGNNFSQTIIVPLKKVKKPLKLVPNPIKRFLGTYHLD